MNDSTEFTPKEKFLISLYKDPAVLFSRGLKRSLTYVIPSVGLVVYALYSDDTTAGLLGYGILLFQTVYRVGVLKRGSKTLSSIIQKYEAKLQNRQDAA